VTEMILECEEPVESRAEGRVEKKASASALALFFWSVDVPTVTAFGRLRQKESLSAKVRSEQLLIKDFLLRRTSSGRAFEDKNRLSHG